MVNHKNINFVTFDIFDTLLHRKIWAPADIFECVRIKAYESELSLLAHNTLKNFVFDRIEAERRSREHRVEVYGGEGEITLDEIYNQYLLVTGCRDELAEFLKKIELEIEHKMLTPSPKGLELYNYYKKAGISVAFISDMYLPSSWLSKTLEDKGFDGSKKLPIFVSCEHRVSKHTGNLFSLVRDSLKIENNNQWLHVGDNLHADIAAAKKHGIQTLHADWSKIDNRYLPVSGTGTSHIVSKIISFLDTPQAKQYIPTDNLESIGYKIFGPLLFGFNAWLSKNCKDENLQDMYFVARDGWFLRALFEKCKLLCGLSEVRTHYFHMSRKVGYQSGIREWDTELNWHLIGSRVPSKLHKLFKNANINIENKRKHLSAFGLNDIDCLHDQHDQGAIKQSLDTLFSESLTETRANRKKYSSYFDILPNDDKPVGLVDIGWAGNIQKTFLHAMSDCTSRDRVHGLYLGTLNSSQRILNKGMRMKGWICNGGVPNHWEHHLTSGGIELLEFLLTADHGSTLGLQTDENGIVTPLMEELSDAEAPYREKALKVQTGVLKFFNDYEFLLSIYNPATLITAEWTKPFERLVTDPNNLELSELASLTHSDAPGCNHERLPLASRQGFRTRISRRRLKRARQQCFWKSAFDKLNK